MESGISDRAASPEPMKEQLRLVYWIAKLNLINIDLGIVYLVLSKKKPSQNGEGEINSGYILSANKPKRQVDFSCEYMKGLRS